MSPLLRRGRQGPRRLQPGGPATLLQEVRLSKGLTQRELAEAADLPTHVVQNAERSRAKAPRPETAEKIAKALGVHVDELWSEAQLAAATPKRESIDDVVVSIKASRRWRGFATPDGGIPVVHYHKPPICCGSCWCRVVNLSDPETYRTVEGPLVPLSVGHA